MPETTLWPPLRKETSRTWKPTVTTHDWNLMSVVFLVFLMDLPCHQQLSTSIRPILVSSSNLDVTSGQQTLVVHMLGTHFRDGQCRGTKKYKVPCPLVQCLSRLGLGCGFIYRVNGRQMPPEVRCRPHVTDVHSHRLRAGEMKVAGEMVARKWTFLGSGSPKTDPELIYVQSISLETQEMSMGV